MNGYSFWVCRLWESRYRVAHATWCGFSRTAIIESFNGLANTFFHREFDFFNEITAVSGVIKAYEKGPPRTKACKDALKQVPPDDYLILPPLETQSTSFVLIAWFSEEEDSDKRQKDHWLTLYSLPRRGSSVG